MNTFSIITIDGPGGSGKSTIANQLAKRLQFIYLNSGLIYRAIAYYAKHNNLIYDIDTLSNHIKALDINIGFENGQNVIILGGENITSFLRDEAIGNIASTVAKHPHIRSQLVHIQRQLSEENSLVAEGRDMGTVIFPHANLKIFLTASVEIRAKRRYQELLNQHKTPDLETIMKDMETRDSNDIKRAEAPLLKAHDAIQIDTSDYKISEVIDNIIKLWQNTNWRG